MRSNIVFKYLKSKYLVMKKKAKKLEIKKEKEGS